MNPVMPNQALVPSANTVSPTGVQAVAPTNAPVPSAIPAPQPNTNPLPVPQTNPTYDTAGMTNNLANYYAIPRNIGQQVTAQEGQAKQAGQQFAKGQFEASVNEQNLKRQLDSSQYTITQDPKSQYGLKIINPLGQQVDFQTYINLTGANPQQTLQQSTDPKAQQFVEAYNNYQTFLQAMMAPKSDEQAQITKQSFFDANPGLQSLTPAQVRNAFLNQYGEFLGMPNASAQPGSIPGLSATLGQINNPATQSGYYELKFSPQLQAQGIQLLNQAQGGNGKSLIQSLLNNQQNPL